MEGIWEFYNKWGTSTKIEPENFRKNGDKPKIDMQKLREII